MTTVTPPSTGTPAPASAAPPSKTANSGYTPIARRPLDVEDYIDVARRHASWIVGPTLAGLVIATIVAFLLPNQYVSTAEMQITPGQISESIVQSTVNQRLNERILQMENEILSRTSLSNLIQDPRLDLYKADRANKPLEDVIEAMRNKDIRIHIDALPGRGASAFSISFTYSDRLKAQQTVQALVTKFIDSNQNTQRNAQNMVKNFVHDELSESKAKLDQLNEELSKFRVENSGKLPEESQLNMAQMGSLQQRATNLNDAMNRLAQEKVQLETNLKTQEDRLRLTEMMEKDITISAPPRIKQQNDLLASMNRNIDGLETQLAQLKQIYKPGYPDIRDAESRLNVLKAQRDETQKKVEAEEAKAEDDSKKNTGVKTTNYAAVQAISEVNASIDQTKSLVKQREMESERLTKDLAATNKAIDAFRDKLAATSGIEAKYAELSSSQRLAQEHYQTVQKQQQITEQNGELLERKAGETLDVLDPPSLPVAPTKPNRWLITGAGVILSFVVGVALAGLQEAKDTSLKNLKDVRAYTNLPVLSSIPLLENTLLVRRKRRIAYLAWSAAVIVGMLAVSASLYYHYTSAT